MFIVDHGPFADREVSPCALVRGGAWWYFIDGLGPVAVFEGELQGWQGVVRERVIGLPDLVEYLQFGGRVVAVVADQFPDPGPVLLRHSNRRFIPRPPRVKVISRCSQ